MKKLEKSYTATYNGQEEIETANFKASTLKEAKRFANAYKRRCINFRCTTTVKPN